MWQSSAMIERRVFGFAERTDSGLGNPGGESPWHGFERLAGCMSVGRAAIGSPSFAPLRTPHSKLSPGGPGRGSKASLADRRDNASVWLGRYVALAFVAMLFSCSSPLTTGHDSGGIGAVGDATTATNGFVQVSAGNDHVCGLRRDGTVACAGGNDRGQATPPAGTFTQIAAGWGFTCGLQGDGNVTCWGGEPPFAGPFTQIAAPYTHACGLRADGSVVCWGSLGNLLTTTLTGTYSQISGGGWLVCGLAADGGVTCWDRSNCGVDMTPPPGAFSQISTGGCHVCGLRAGGAAACWGSNWFGETDIPGGTFAQISAGDSGTCGLRANGTVTCWGVLIPVAGNMGSPPGTFTRISVDGNLACGLLTDGSITCWGNPLTLEP